MFSNYHYFLVFAEELNVTRAADRLFISHQNLSKYLSNLEKKLGVRLFVRKPYISLTKEGKLLLDTFRQAEVLEHSLKDQYAELQGDKTGEIRLGTTEGRFRILMPDIMSEFMGKYPEVHLNIVSAPSPDLQDMILNDQLDLVVFGIPQERSRYIHYTEILQEHLYLVVSDAMLKAQFGEEYAARREQFRKGADLRLFRGMPFALNLPIYNSSRLIREHLESIGAEINCVHVSSHPDLHHMMSARDYAASVCLTLYLPSLLKLNAENGNRLNVFPIQGLTGTNPVVIARHQDRTFPGHTQDLIRMLSRQCADFARYDLPPVE